MSHIALSYSRYNQYLLCPFKFWKQYIDKSYPDEGDNYFFKKGQRKHEQMEHYVNHHANPLSAGTFRYDDDVQEYFPMIDNICASMPKYSAETKLAVDTNFEPCSWFDKSTMFRAIVDFNAVSDFLMLVIDWKTGKVREYDGKPTGQLHLTAAMMFAHNPEVREIVTTYAFIEHKQNLKTSFTRDVDLKTPFFKLFEEVNAVKEWCQTKNEYCKYCLVTRAECPNAKG